MRISGFLKNLSIVSVLAFMIFVDAGGQSKVLSLNECISIGLKNHPDYQRAVLNTELNRNEIIRVKSNWLPQMSVDMGQGTNIGRSIDRFTNTYINELYNSTFAQVSIQQSVFQSYRIKHLVDAGELANLSGEHLVAAMKNSLTIRIIQAYLQVLQANELSEMTLRQLQASGEQVALIQLQVDAGTLAARELLQIQTQMTNDQFSAQSMKGQAQRAILNLVQLLNAEYDENLRFEPITENQMVVSSGRLPDLKALPELRAADLQLKSFDSQLKAIKAQNYPSVFFFANYSTFYASSNQAEDFLAQLNGARNGSINVSLSIPIFAKLQTNPQSQAIQIQKRLTQNQLRNTEQQANQTYRISLQNYMIAREQYETAQNQVEIGSRNLKAVESQLDAGTITPSDYILAKNNLERANSNLIQSKYACMLEQKIIEFYQNGSWSF